MHLLLQNVTSVPKAHGLGYAAVTAQRPAHLGNLGNALAALRLLRHTPGHVPWAWKSHFQQRVHHFLARPVHGLTIIFQQMHTNSGRALNACLKSDETRSNA